MNDVEITNEIRTAYRLNMPETAHAWEDELERREKQFIRRLKFHQVAKNVLVWAVVALLGSAGVWAILMGRW